MNNKKLIVIISTIVLIFICFGVYFLLKGRDLTNTNEIKYENFTILDGHSGKLAPYDKTLYVEGYKGSYDNAYYIEGNIKNNSTLTYSFVILTFDLFDKDNNNLGQAVCGIENVSNKVYSFKAMSLTTTNDAKKVVSYKLNSIKAS